MTESRGTDPGPTPAPDSSSAIDWRTLHIWQIQPLRDVLALIAILALIYLGYMLSLVTVPLLLALLLAYLVEPLMRKLMSLKFISRQAAAAGLIVLAILAVAAPLSVGVGIGALQGAASMQQQVANIQTLWKSVETPENPELAAALPGENWRKLRLWLLDLKAEADRAKAAKAIVLTDGKSAKPVEPPTPAGVATAGESGEAAQPERAPRATALMAYQAAEWLVQNIKKNSAELGATFVQTSTVALRGGLGLLESLVMLGFGTFLTAFFFFYISSNYERVARFLAELLPDRSKAETLRLVGRMDLAISGFVRGRLTICFILIIYFTLAYWIIGVSVPLALGPIVGVLCLVPYAASLGIPVAILLMFLQPGWAPWQDQIWWIIGAPLVVHTLAQVLDDYILSPQIQGKNTGMDTPTILFASISGGILAGFYGLLIAIPVAACVKIAVQEIVWPRFLAWREGRARDLLPLETAANCPAPSPDAPPRTPVH